MGDVSTLWTLEADGTEAAASLDELMASLDAVSASVSDAAASASDLSALDDALASVAGSGSALDDALAGLDASLSGVQAAADAASGSVGGLGGAADSASGQIDALGGSAGTASASLDADAVSAEGASVAMDGLAVSTDAVNKGMNAMKMPALLAGAAVLAAGAISVKMAGDFQSSMTQLVTGAGESQSNLKMVSDGILNMATQTGESTGQLAKGMYMIESAGYHGKAGLAVLLASAEGAKVGAADLGTVADATTTILNDFGSKGVTASNAVNLLVATVASGKTHMQDLASSLAQILPTAASANVGINDVMGAMATMTGEGVPAANAATYLRQTILALDSPSAAAAKALQSVGLTTDEVSTTMQKSLPAAIQMITEAVGKKFPVGSAAYVNAIKNISGGVKTMQGMLDLSGSHMKTFQQNTAGITASVKQGGNSIAGWGAVQGDFNQKMDRLGATIEVAAIKVGGKLLPVLGNLATILAARLPGAIDGIERGFQFVTTHADQLSPILGILAGVIGGALVFALVTAAAAAWALVAPVLIAAAPFLLVGAAIGLVVVGIYELVKHWGAVKAFFANIGAAIMGFIGHVWSAITGFFGRVASAISTTVAKWGADFMQGLNVIKGIIQSAFNGYVWLVQEPFRLIVQLFAWLFSHNYYFHDLVVSIQNDFLAGKAMMLAIWHDIQAALGAVWAFIQGVARNDWLAIQRFIIQPIQHAVAVVEERINYARAVLTAAWAIISSEVTAAWNHFEGVISGAIATVAGDVQQVVNAILTPIENLGGMMLSAGQHLIQMLIQGIKSQIGAVESAAGGIANSIKGMLGFHSPTEKGPGATADRWMPALGAMLERDLLAQTSRVQAAASKVAGAIATGIHSPTAGAGAIGVAGVAGGGAGGLPAGLTSSLGGGALGGAGGGNAQLLAQLVEALRGGGNRVAPLGTMPVSANTGAVTQNFGGMTFNGVSNVNELFNILNALGGLAQENGTRGATLGLGL